ncbi:MAG: HPr(Ser) kinase/phosphatase [Candidatus Omnitrophica bacterium]|nr:HPr(Ser) kinase/phosphatase [Candidatus Omnitrophota bacterium]
MAVVTVGNLLEDKGKEFKLQLVNRKANLKKTIKVVEPHRPGLALAGWYEYFAYDRPQILGQTEIFYLKSLSSRERRKNLDKFFSYDIPCLLVARGLTAPRYLLEYANRKRIAVIQSPFETAILMSKVTLYLEDRFSPQTSIHGTLVDVYGVGVLILGKSGVGKSESALELVERGHRLVADDVVDIQLLDGEILMGSSAAIIRHHMEIRGLGIINIKEIFGVGAVRNRKRIGLVVTLEKWDQRKEYERLGLEEQKHKILGAALPHFVIPVRPGRNLSILIEVSALNERLKRMGTYPARELNQRLIAAMKGGFKGRGPDDIY